MEARSETLQARRGERMGVGAGRGELEGPTPERPSGAVRNARALGWLSVGLGVAQLLTPDGVSRLAVGANGRWRERTMRALGVREIVTGIGLLGRRRPTGWLWARVAGDLMDLALLRASMNRRNRARVMGSMGAVAGIALIDTLASIQLTRSRRTEGRFRHLTSSVTVNRSPEEVYRFWRDLQNLPRFMAHLEGVQHRDERRSHWIARGPAGKKVEWDAEIVEDRPNELLCWRTLPGADVDHVGFVRFERAPGNRGTEVHVEMDYLPPAGIFGASLAKLLGRQPRQQVENDLRRLKQVMETGEVLHSDASIHRGTHPARPGDGHPHVGGRR